MDLVFSEEALQYRSAGHPESPERVKVAYQYLQDKYETTSPEEATYDDLLTVHKEPFVEKVKNKTFMDPDCPKYDNLFYHALLSAGGGITAQQTDNLSLMRPPGHHAGKDFLGGFCYFNNLAIAVKKSGVKTLIVDFDAHHGNGTQDIFLGDDQVVYISLHRSPAFPGTGTETIENAINFPISPSTGDRKYMEVLRGALDKIDVSNFEQLALSAGFDGHKADPLASVGLSTGVYKEIGSLLAGLNLPAFGVLEGGYVGEDLGRNIDSFLSGFNES